MRGFALSDWVAYWTREFHILVRTFGANEYHLEPIESKHDRIIAGLEEKADDPDEGYRERKILDSLFGPKIIQYANEEFWKVSARIELAIPPGEWRAMSLSEQGKYIACIQQRNRIDTLRRYAMELKRNR